MKFAVNIREFRAAEQEHGPKVQAWLDAEGAKINAEWASWQKVEAKEEAHHLTGIFAAMGLSYPRDIDKFTKDAILKSLDGPGAALLRELYRAYIAHQRTAKNKERAFKSRMTRLNNQAMPKLIREVAKTVKVRP